MDARLTKLLARPENQFCADCREPRPKWCSVKIGVLICTECAGIHRKLGTHISFVQSTNLDRWKDPWIELLAEVGNEVGAKLYEASLPSDWPRLRLRSIGDRVDSANAAHMESFIRAKYEHKLFSRGNPLALRDRVIDKFFEGLRLRALEERRQFEARGAPIQMAKMNSQNLYIDDSLRAVAIARSRAFVDSKKEWLIGPCMLSYEALLSRVALQHFIDIDLEDLSLDQKRRRSANAFTGPYVDINDQFLKDVSRSEYNFCGEEFGCWRDADLLAADRSAPSTGFSETVDRHVAALRHCFENVPSSMLPRAVSTLMSQSSMALLDRACCSPVIAVSGGESRVRYDLEVVAENTWDVRLTLRKEGFTQAFIYDKVLPGESNPSPAAPTLVPACGPGSVVAKSCVLRVRWLQDDDLVKVEVVDFEDNLEIFDADGRRLTLERARSAIVETFFVLLRRVHDDEPLGLAPCRASLRRGVLKLRAPVAAGSTAEQWNLTRLEGQEVCSKLQEGDIITSVNGVVVNRSDGGKAALLGLKQPQSFLSVLRAKTFCQDLVYSSLIVRVYRLFNPGKLISVDKLFLKHPDLHGLFLSVCRKYAICTEDWQDVLQCFLDGPWVNSEVRKVVSNAGTHLKILQAGKELDLLEAVCKRLIEGTAPAKYDKDQNDAKKDDAPDRKSPSLKATLPASSRSVEENDLSFLDAYPTWPVILLTLHILDRQKRIGMRQDSRLLQEKRILRVLQVHTDTLAAAAGLLAGDIITEIGGEDAADVVLSGTPLASRSGLDGILSLTVRRAPPHDSRSDVAEDAISEGCSELEPLPTISAPFYTEAYELGAVMEKCARNYVDLNEGELMVKGFETKAVKKASGEAGTEAAAKAMEIMKAEADVKVDKEARAAVTATTVAEAGAEVAMKVAEVNVTVEALATAKAAAEGAVSTNEKEAPGAAQEQMVDEVAKAKTDSEALANVVEVLAKVKSEAAATEVASALEVVQASGDAEADRVNEDAVMAQVAATRAKANVKDEEEKNVAVEAKAIVEGDMKAASGVEGANADEEADAALEAELGANASEPGLAADVKAGKEVAAVVVARGEVADEGTTHQENVEQRADTANVTAETKPDVIAQAEVAVEAFKVGGNSEAGVVDEGEAMALTIQFRVNANVKAEEESNASVEAKARAEGEAKATSEVARSDANSGADAGVETEIAEEVSERDGPADIKVDIGPVGGEDTDEGAKAQGDAEEGAEIANPTVKTEPASIAYAAEAAEDAKARAHVEAEVRHEAEVMVLATETRAKANIKGEEETDATVEATAKVEGETKTALDGETGPGVETKIAVEASEPRESADITVDKEAPAVVTLEEEAGGEGAKSWSDADRGVEHVNVMAKTDPDVIAHAAEAVDFAKTSPDTEADASAEAEAPARAFEAMATADGKATEQTETVVTLKGCAKIEAGDEAEAGGKSNLAGGAEDVGPAVAEDEGEVVDEATKLIADAGAGVNAVDAVVHDFAVAEAVTEADGAAGTEAVAQGDASDALATDGKAEGERGAVVEAGIKVVAEALEADADTGAEARAAEAAAKVLVVSFGEVAEAEAGADAAVAGAATLATEAELAPEEGPAVTAMASTSADREAAKLKSCAEVQATVAAEVWDVSVNPKPDEAMGDIEEMDAEEGLEVKSDASDGGTTESQKASVAGEALASAKEVVEAKAADVWGQTVMESAGSEADAKVAEVAADIE